MEKAKAILAEAAMTVEAEAKKELDKGHGVKTGTLRRSIHVAKPDYNFGSDNVENGPERGGVMVTPEKEGDTILKLAVGSGMVYAMAIHQGWNWQKDGLIGVFAGYHYLTNGMEKMRGKLDTIIARHQVKE